MKFLYKVFLVILVLQTGFVFSQTSDKGKPVKWEVLSGKNNEFIIYMPGNYEMLSDGNYFTGNAGINSNGKVNKKLVIYRYINKVVLMMEYLQGDAKQVLKNLLANEKAQTEELKEINGFDFAEISKNEEGFYKKKQFFRIKDRIYVVQAYSKSEDNKIADSFFKSVKLINEEKAVSPNVAEQVKSITLPTIDEHDPEKLGDEKPVESKEADRKAIIIHTPRPKFRPRDLINTNKGKIKMRILYSSSGKVSSVEVLESSGKSLEKPAIEAAKKTIFIPAEKDGKLVSSYQTQEFGFGVSSSVFFF